MIFRQFVDEDLGCASYLVGDESVGEALVVDPAFRVEQYLDAAERHDVRIVRVLETHTHADHVSGHGRLALEHGVPVAIHDAADADYPHEALADGDEIAVGHVVVRVIYTPGHRPEHCAFAVLDEARELVLGDVALPAHLPNVERILALNRGPFVTAPPPLEPLAALPADAVVLDVRPSDASAAGHVHGALNVPVSGSGFATKAGFVLSPEARVAIHASSDGEAARAAAGLNAVGFLDLAGYVIDASATEPLRGVEVEELEHLLADGVAVLDVREKDERDRGYIPGTRHVPYRVVRQAAEEGLVNGGPVVTICETGARAAIAASVLQAAGVEARAVLHGGVATWTALGGETVQFRRCGC